MLRCLYLEHGIFLFENLERLVLPVWILDIMKRNDILIWTVKLRAGKLATLSSISRGSSSSIVLLDDVLSLFECLSSIFVFNMYRALSLYMM